ncbi:hypothetical protein [Halalkaliarchaeum desulfuricum]|nr:hypothetical protein [Halalkaliarchaeum desulfuricum]
MADKRDRDHPLRDVEEASQLDENPLRNYIANETTEVRCEICGRIEESEEGLVGVPCSHGEKHVDEALDIGDGGCVSVTEVLSSETPRLDDVPDNIAETLIETDHSYVRIDILGGALSVPAEAYTSTTHDVQLNSFYAYLRDATEEDGGGSFMGLLKISEQMARHLQIDNVGEDKEPLTSIDIWTSRPELALGDELKGYRDAPKTQVLSALGLSDDGPYIHHLEEAIKEGHPVSPLNPPKLQIHYPTSEPSPRSYRSHTYTHSRYVTESIGQIAGVEPLSRSEVPDYSIVDEEPEKKGPEPPYISPFASHPTIGWDTLESLEPTETIIDALYTINKYAKEEAENGTKCYKSGEKARAKVHSVRKTALYAVKSIAIHRLVKADPDNVTVKKHEIDGNEFWCFCFEAFGQSFHQPVEAVVSDAIDTIANSDGTVESDDAAEIELKSDIPGNLADLESALETLATDHGIDANDYLTQHRVTESTGHLPSEFVEHSTKFDIDISSQWL